MAELYKISDELKNIQNTLIKNTIAQNTNVQLLQSEQALRDLYASYSDKLQKVGSKLFTLTDHIVRAQQLITKDYFDELFQDIYVDLKSLYSYIKYIDDLLDINLNKNIKFFNTIEKKIVELENKLDLTRLNVNNIITFDKVFFEGFSNASRANSYTNLDLDKKTGHLTLKPIEKKYLNKSHFIKNVQTTLYPVPNEDGGVHVTTDILNTYEDSYRRDGTNDMLENGLWKEQVFCNEIPNMEVYINKNIQDAQLIKLQTQGIVAFVDIEFKYIIEMNNLDIDLFGEYETSILQVLSKVNESDPWVPLTKLSKKVVDSDISYVDNFGETSAFNVIKFRNIELLSARYIRIVFNQKNYTLVNNTVNNIQTMSKKINDDLSERRLELVKLDGGNRGKPAIPKSYNYDSLYAELTHVVEYSSNINEMLLNIIKIFEPTANSIKTDLNKTLQYEVGAWSIEPKLIRYQGKGIFKSGNYVYSEKSLVSASIITKQEDIKENTCNWYLSDTKNAQLLPIIPNDEIIRKETVNFIYNRYLIDQGWKNGSFIQLDFPISKTYIYALKIYEDGREIPYSQLKTLFLNSTLMYIENITDPLKHNYIIKYIPAKYETVNVFRLVKNKPYVKTNVLEYNIIASRESALRLFLDKTNLNQDYTIKRVRCTIEEYNGYFNNQYNICIDTTYYNKYSTVINNYLYPKIIQNFKDTLYQDYLDGDLSNELVNVFDLPTIPFVYERVI